MTVIDVRVPARHVPLDTVFNLRDLGGHRTADGRWVTFGRLYRSDGLHHLAGPDLERVRSLGLRTVLDLRTTVELGDGVFPLAAHPATLHHLPVLADTWVDDDEVGALVDRGTPNHGARYIDQQAEGGPAIAKAVPINAEEQACPLVFHCAAGKDRTGVLAALVLSVLGVPDEEVAADYALSADAMARRLAWLQQHHPEGAVLMARQPAGWLAAPAEAMLALLAHLRRVHGGAAGYLADQGVESLTIESLSARMLIQDG
jgi:protein-tyrosine phosphatase